jgi:hypothetical protein
MAYTWPTSWSTASLTRQARTPWRAQQHPEVVMNPVKIAEAVYYLHTQDKSCWTHELQLPPFATTPSF